MKATVQPGGVKPNRDPLPTRQGAGRRNLDLFLAGSRTSPICFYFEDEGCEELYVRLLRRLFPKYSRPLVVCTGGKTKKSVLASATTHQIEPIVFVQDKDFDDINGTLPSDPRVVTLHRYSFENYLLEAEALVELAIESKRRLRKAEAADALGLPDYLSSLYAGFSPLASLYAVALRLNLRAIKTTKQSVFDVCGVGATAVSGAALSAYRARVLAAALGSQKVGTEADFASLELNALLPKPQYVGHADNHPNAHLCGKQLLDLALSYVDGKVDTSLSKLERFEVAMRLVLHVPLDAFDRVRRCIVEALEKQKVPEDVMRLLA